MENEKKWSAVISKKLSWSLLGCSSIKKKIPQRRSTENSSKLKGDDCDCPVPCDTISFQPVLSYAVFNRSILH